MGTAMGTVSHGHSQSWVQSVLPAIAVQLMVAAIYGRSYCSSHRLRAVYSLSEGCTEGPAQSRGPRRAPEVDRKQDTLTLEPISHPAGYPDPGLSEDRMEP